MLKSKFFLNISILFIFNLLVLSCFTLSSDKAEDVFITHFSNDDSIYQVRMNLNNAENSLSIVYDMFSTQFNASITIKNLDSKKIDIKTIKLFVCDTSSNVKPSIMAVSSDVFFDDLKVNKDCFDCNVCFKYEHNVVGFNSCSKDWQRLLDEANGSNLCFNVVCVDMDSKVEREYLFRVSSSNLQKFIDSVNFGLKVITEFYSNKRVN